MKISKFILFYFITSLFFTLSLHAGLDDKVHFALSISKFDKVTQNRIKRLTLRLVEELKKDSSLDIDITFVDNINNVKKDFKKYNNFVAYSTFFLENINFFKENGKATFIFNDTENNLSQYYLVASKKSGIKTISDLKGKVLNSLMTTNYYNMWLDYLSLKEFGKPYREIIKKEISEVKQNKKLLNVYFNKADFTVVSKVAYDDVLLLNPSIIKNLVIVKKSEPIFFYAIGVFHKNTPDSLINKFFSTLNKQENANGLSSIYKLIGINNIKKREFKDFDKLIEFYNEYKKLKKVN